MRETINEVRDGMEIDLQKLLLAYLNKWWLILLSIIITAALTLGYSAYCITPLYRASVTIYVNNSRADQQVDYVTSTNLSTAQKLVATYVNIIESDTVLTEVIESGGFQCTPGYIRNIMTAAQVDSTEIFTVSITHPDPQMAADLANTIAEVAPGRIAGFVEGSSTKIIDYAKVPNTRYSPSYQRNTILGAIVGAVLAMLYITIVYLLDVRIKTSEDLEQLFDAPILAQIPVFDAVPGRKSDYAYGEGTGKTGSSKKSEVR